MQGYRLLALDKDGKPFDHGVIVERITPERYLCQFARLPARCLILSLDQLMSYQLFPDDEQLNAFILSLTPPAPKPAKKKAKKKSTRRKTDGTR